MKFQLYNTLTRKVEPIIPDESNKIRMYTCGPTVYNYAHIGNLRSFILPDVLYRTLTKLGYQVEWVMNITDIDDKTILGTVAEYGPEATPTQLQHFTQKYYDAFLEDLRTVNVSVDSINFIPVTSLMSQIQEFIVGLVDKGLAYRAEDGSTYFSIEEYQKRFGDYGALVGEKFLEGKRIGARISHDEYEKESLSDFALWKSHSEADANIFWYHDRLGKGRPGWHIECSVVNDIAFKGKTVDIHTGGVDLIFPHHTNEIAQSQPFATPFVNHWMHIEHIQVDNKKMAKRLNNFYTMKDLTAKGFSGSDLRYLFLQGHYKTQQNFTFESLQGAKNAVQKLAQAYHTSIREQPSESGAFMDALADNLNIPEALATVWENKSGIADFNEILGLTFLQPDRIDIPEEIQKLIDSRQIARELKDFAKSDELRNMIEKLGYDINDTAAGQTITKKSS